MKQQFLKIVITFSHCSHIIAVYMRTKKKRNKIYMREREFHILRDIQWAWKLSIKSRERERELLIGKLYFLSVTRLFADPHCENLATHVNLTSLANNNNNNGVINKDIFWKVEFWLKSYFKNKINLQKFCQVFPTRNIKNLSSMKFSSNFIFLIVINRFSFRRC